MGVVAPLPPGSDATEIQLQVSLIDINSGTEYDKREITLDIVDEPEPATEITLFCICNDRISLVSVNASSLESGEAILPVGWEVANRPENTNLLFEQVMPDGSVENVELPRTDPIIPSSGFGAVAPLWPGEDAESILLSVRLIDLDTEEALDLEQIELPISSLAAGDQETTSGQETTDEDATIDGDSGGGSEDAVVCGFTDTFQPDACPTSQNDVPIVYQTFENGMMVWRGDTRQVHVLYDDGRYEIYNDTWTEDLPESTGETPPDGLVLPVRGFGHVWANEADVRDSIGWATGDEISYGTKLEVYDDPDSPMTVYMLIPDGRTLILGDQWEAR